MKKILSSLILAITVFAPAAAMAAPRTYVARVRTIRYHDRTPHVRVAKPTKAH